MATSDVIRTRRVELGLSQTELARRVGTDARNIRRYESGETQLTLAMARNLAAALEIGLEELAGGPPTLAGAWWVIWDGLGPETIGGPVEVTHRGRDVDVYPAAVKDPRHTDADLQWRSGLRADGDDLLGWFDLSYGKERARGTLMLQQRGDAISGGWLKISLGGLTAGHLAMARTADAAEQALAALVASGKAW